MRILSEIIGGIVLLLIFAYGVRETIKFLSTSRGKQNDEHDDGPDAAGKQPG
jgi:hypothetical protein